ncbi:ABC transporter substrate-binding protein [Deinococcus detaillensis]|uniref:ABC transporter substrate-binding protein n=1 Tax=Deinococcus detaillensis TaxID=2592048 RepID=A0A553V613_9DEIO|nr:ABC transporter substrate-binding protein [Deinococcus detaillensis]TSA87907.1 ABC transporter substrate-binding protein [Deinococcus detaillensis]
MSRFLFTAVLSLGLLGATQAQTPPLPTIHIGLGYIPNVQFTPFYVAKRLDYFKAEGLNVEYQHGYVSELIPLLLQGKLDFVVGDPEDAILARSAGQPVKYIMAMYQKVPATVFSLASKNIRTPADLKGKVIGIPGTFGSTYFALGALLDSAGLKESDVKLASIGFTQLEAVRGGKVDAAVGFVNNEVVNLKAAGVPVNTLDVTAAYPMVGVGIITTDKNAQTALAKKVVRASQRAMRLTINDPAQAFKIGLKDFGSGGGTLSVLQASLPLMQSSATKVSGLGYSDPAAWTKAVAYLQKQGKVPSSAKASDFFSNAAISKTLK